MGIQQESSRKYGSSHKVANCCFKCGSTSCSGNCDGGCNKCQSESCTGGCGQKTPKCSSCGHKTCRCGQKKKKSCNRCGKSSCNGGCQKKNKGCSTCGKSSCSGGCHKQNKGCNNCGKKNCDGGCEESHSEKEECNKCGQSPCECGRKRGCCSSSCCSWRGSRVKPLRITAIVFFALGLALLLACLIYAIVDSSHHTHYGAADTVVTESVVAVHSDLSNGIYEEDAFAASSTTVHHPPPAIIHAQNHAPHGAVVVAPAAGGFVAAGSAEVALDVGVFGPKHLPHCGHCSTDPRYVCGEDLRTYYNRCFAQCAGISVLSAGRCRPTAPSLYHPLLVT